MKPTVPIIPGENLPVTEIAEGQEEYQTLSAYIDPEGTVLVRWKLDWGERIEILFSGDIYHWIWAGKNLVQPVMLSTEAPKMNKEE